MAGKEPTTSDWLKTRAVLRKLGVRAGISPGKSVGLKFMIAATAKVAGLDGAGEALRAAGLEDVPGFLAAIPDASEEDVDGLPELKADTRLAAVIQEDLKEFLSGKAGAESALRVLLEPRNVNPDVRRFLADPTRLFARGFDDEIQGTRELLRGLTAYYQPRFHAGYRHYVVDAATGYSAFQKGEDFAKVISKLREGERRAIRSVFSSFLYEKSPLGACRRKYGVLEAHILGATVLGEMALVAQGPLCVNAVAWTVDPVRYHRLIGFVLGRVVHLRDEGLLCMHPDVDEVRLQSHVFLAESTMDEFLCFLRKADPITDEEICEMRSMD